MIESVKLFDINCIRLSRKVTIGDYLKFQTERDKKKIANFLYKRFHERYIKPYEYIHDSKNKSGFSMMASCCLMIEALESFYNGWKDTNGRSELAFCKFFDRVKQFKNFDGFSSEFYKNVRCGILHQAETTKGWRILRRGPLFDSENLTINTNKFLKALKEYLIEYKRDLENADWDSDIWNNLRKKMSYIIKNCERS